MTTSTRSSTPSPQGSRAVIARHNRAVLLNDLRRQWQRGRFTAVIKSARNVMKTWGECGSASTVRILSRLAAQASIELRDMESAVQWCDCGLERTPDDVSLLTILSECEFLAGHLLSARCLAQRATGNDPNRTSTHEQLARVCAAQGDAFGALESFEAALACCPQSNRLRVQLAQLALECQAWSVGLDALSQLVDPPSLLCARLLRGQGSLREAVDAYQRFLQAHRDRGTTRSISPSSDVTIALQCESATPCQDLCEAQLELIELYHEIGQADAIQDLARVWVRSKPADATVGLSLARTLLAQGDVRRAVVIARRVAQLDPAKRSQAMMVITAAATVANRTKLAHWAARQSDQSDRTANAIIWRRALEGEIVLEQHSAVAAGADPSSSMLGCLLGSARTTLARAVKENPGYADLRFHHAKVLEALGCAGQARLEMKRAIEINPRYSRLEADWCDQRQAA